MTAQETVIVARLADHYEKLGLKDDVYETAKHDFLKFKREAPLLFDHVWTSKAKARDTSRAVGDWLYDFIMRWYQSGMSFKNFAADELEKS